MSGADPAAPSTEIESRLAARVRAMTPAAPELLQHRLLQRRFDRKYLVSTADVAGLLDQLTDSHAVLLADDRHLARYRTAYFDTHERRAFFDHSRGRPRRAKVRVRTYADRSLSVLEIKQRTGRGTTIKARRPRPQSDAPLSPEERAWIADQLPWAADLTPAASNVFRRVTLLGVNEVERLTIDVHLRFVVGCRSMDIHNTAIIEVKTPTRGQPSRAVSWLHAQGLRPMGFSKYCAASVLLDESLPDHAFRRALRVMSRLEAA